MKLVGLREGGSVLVGVLSDDRVAPLASVDDFYADVEGWLARARELGPGDLVLADARLAPPIPTAARVLCLGLNYAAHAAEGSFEVPKNPTVFGRWTSSLSVDGAPVTVPPGEHGLDWEGEVAAVIGAPLREASADDALAAVIGYAAFNDLSARRMQRRAGQWTLGKNADGSGPMGPIVTVDEVGDLTAGLRLVTRVNGEVMQDGNTRDMIFGVGEVLAMASTVMTLQPGDVLVTGTPDGVGYARTPPRWLVPGDVVEVEVERLGVIRTPVVERSTEG